MKNSIAPNRSLTIVVTWITMQQIWAWGIVVLSAFFASGQSMPYSADSMLTRFTVTAVTTANYTIRCKTDASGKIIDSKFCYEQSVAGNPDQLRIVLMDSSGREQIMVVDPASACAYYCHKELLPTKAPDSIIGTNRYYNWRYNDCRIRNLVLGNSSSVPDYYLNYGDKYAARFTTEVRPKLSSKGQKWLDKTVLLFQMATEALVLENNASELNDAEFRHQLFDLHPKVYEAAGFFELSPRDQLIIVSHIDPKDILSEEGRMQIRQLSRDYVPYFLKKCTNHYFRRGKH